MLHASAVLTAKGAIGFLGQAGWGKSTLAAGLTKVGARLLTDDCFSLELRDRSARCIPAYEGLRLLPDSLEYCYPDKPEVREFSHYSWKKRLQLHPVESVGIPRSYPLKAIFILTPPDESCAIDCPMIGDLSAAQALIALIKHSFKLDLSDKIRISRSFDEMSDCAAVLAAYSLRYPRIHSLLPDVCRAVMDKIEKS